MHSIQDQIKELERELAVRRRVYPWWIRDGKIDEETATKRIELMRAAISSLRAYAVSKDQLALEL